MKKAIVLALIFFIGEICAQSTREIKMYYDSNWVVTKKGCGASYYRIFQVDKNGKPVGKILDYYRTGELQGETESAIFIDPHDDKHSVFKGKVTGYLRNRNKLFETMYDENGRLLSQTHYYDNGNVSFSSQVEGENTITDYYEQDGNRYSRESLTRDTLNGWNYTYYKNGEIKTKEEYIHGILKDHLTYECDEQGKWTKGYYDFFDKEEDSGAWIKVNNEQVRAKIYGGHGYMFENLIDKTFAFPVREVNLFSGDFSIEAIMKFQAGNTGSFYGIEFGYLDKNNYSGFLVNPEGYVIIVHTIDGVRNEVLSELSQFVNPGVSQNVLKITGLNKRIFYSINGRVVYSDARAQCPGNRVSAYFGGMANTLCRAFVIKKSIEDHETRNTAMSEWSGNGTGFFIDRKGVIVTNHHVVAGSKIFEVTVYTNGNKRTYPADVIATDEENDLALLKIQAKDFKTVKKIPYNIRNVNTEVGSGVFTLGFPMAISVLGEEIKFSDGKVSAHSGFYGSNRYYQVTLPVLPGNSGGPLFDEAGNIVGIVTAGLHNSPNVSYAVKGSYINELKRSINIGSQGAKGKSSKETKLTEQIKDLSDFVVLIKTK